MMSPYLTMGEHVETSTQPNFPFKIQKWIVYQKHCTVKAINATTENFHPS